MSPSLLRIAKGEVMEIADGVAALKQDLLEESQREGTFTI